MKLDRAEPFEPVFGEISARLPAQCVSQFGQCRVGARAWILINLGMLLLYFYDICVVNFLRRLVHQ